MPKQLSPAQVEQFWNDGFLFPVDAFDGVQAKKYRNLLEEAERDHPEEIHTEHRNNAHYILKFLDEIAHHPVILDVMEDLLGPDVLLTGTVLFIKEPQTPAFVSWHQDSTYTGIDPKEGITVWLALSEADSESGCMQMIQGSHHQGILEHHDCFGENNILTRGQTIEGIEKEHAVDVTLFLVNAFPHVHAHDLSYSPRELRPVGAFDQLSHFGVWVPGDVITKRH